MYYLKCKMYFKLNSDRFEIILKKLPIIRCLLQTYPTDPVRLRFSVTDGGNQVRHISSILL